MRVKKPPHAALPTRSPKAGSEKGSALLRTGLPPPSPPDPRERLRDTTAVVSVPWAVAALAGYTLGGERGLATKEAPEIGRVYFLVPVQVGHDRSTFLNGDGVEVHYFWTRKDAMAWSDRDAERRLELER